jgi:hypothetical protein
MNNKAAQKKCLQPLESIMELDHQWNLNIKEKVKDLKVTSNIKEKNKRISYNACTEWREYTIKAGTWIYTTGLKRSWMPKENNYCKLSGRGN